MLPVRQKSSQLATTQYSVSLATSYRVISIKLSKVRTPQLSYWEPQTAKSHCPNGNHDLNCEIKGKSFIDLISKRHYRSDNYRIFAGVAVAHGLPMLCKPQRLTSNLPVATCRSCPYSKSSSVANAIVQLRFWLQYRLSRYLIRTCDRHLTYSGSKLYETY